MFKNFSPGLLGISGLQSEIIELALSYGFRGMDIDYVDLAAAVRSKGLAYARRFIQSARIKVGACRFPVPLDAEQERFEHELARFAQDASWLVELGCTRCLANVRPYSDTLPYHENFEFHKSRILEIVKALKEHGLRLALGFNAAPTARQGRAFEFIHAPDAMEALLGMVPSQNVALVFDPWQYVAAGIAPQNIKVPAADKIAYVVASDVSAEGSIAANQEESRVLPGTKGVIPIDKFLTTLESQGYHGPVSPAAHKSRVRGQSREWLARAAGEAMIRLWPRAEPLPPALAPPMQVATVAEEEVPATADEVPAVDAAE